MNLDPHIRPRVTRGGTLAAVFRRDVVEVR
jgi:hypothetical protein